QVAVALAPTATSAPTATPEATATPVATATPAPTLTPRPTSTPAATKTPAATATPTPMPTTPLQVGQSVMAPGSKPGSQFKLTITGIDSRTELPAAYGRGVTQKAKG